MRLVLLSLLPPHSLTFGSAVLVSLGSRVRFNRLPFNLRLRLTECSSQNSETRAEVENLVAAGDHAELEKRFSVRSHPSLDCNKLAHNDAIQRRIAFGTAGLRGPMQAGPSAMNDLVILQASQGLAKYAEQSIEFAKGKGIVVGHDHRHNSAQFARLTAGVFRRRGWTVYELDGLVHTPMVPFSVRQLGAALGVMITARCVLDSLSLRPFAMLTSFRQPQSGSRQRLQGVLVQRDPNHTSA